ncbi:probable beta-1,4-xylosyltransferase IRX10L [Tanacetum coccineum]
MIKSSNGETPFSLTYDTKAVIPAEIGMPTLRTVEVDPTKNDEALKINLDLIEKKREQAAIQKAKSKTKMKKYYNSRVRGTSFKPGDMVYRSNDLNFLLDFKIYPLFKIMRDLKWAFVFLVVLFGFLLNLDHAFELRKGQKTERISGSAGDVLEDDPVGRLKVFVYELPSKYNKKILQKDPRCLNHMFAAEIYMHRFLLSSPVRTLNPEEADWFYTPVYTTCDLTPNGLPLPFKSPRMMRSAIQLISSNWPYWNRTEGADHFFIVPHDFGACFHYQEEKAIERGILPLLQRATLVQTFGQRNHVCLKEGSITVPPYAPPQKMQSHLIPPSIPRSIFVYFRGLFYDNTTKSYTKTCKAVFCLCPLGWAPWSPRLVEAVIFGCIPVIIADDIVLPFADAIPWEDIGVYVDEKDVPI